MAGLIYATAADQLNMAKFMCVVPSHYFPNAPEAYVEGVPDLDIASAILGLKTPNNQGRPGARGRFDADLGMWIPQKQTMNPIYNPEYPDARTRSQITIAQMIDMHNTKVPFEIIDWGDVVRVFHSLDSYALEMERMVNGGDREIIRYMYKVAAFRAVMYTQFLRALRRNPSWVNHYSNGEAKIKAFFDLMFSVTKDKRFEIDPIRQLREFPYRIPVIDRPGTQEKETSPQQYMIHPDKQEAQPNAMPRNGPSGVVYQVR